MINLIIWDYPANKPDGNSLLIGPKDTLITMKTTKAHKEALEELAKSNNQSLSSCIINCTTENMIIQQEHLIKKQYLLEQLANMEQACIDNDYPILLEKVREVKNILMEVR